MAVPFRHNTPPPSSLRAVGIFFYFYLQLPLCSRSRVYRNSLKYFRIHLNVQLKAQKKNLIDEKKKILFSKFPDGLLKNGLKGIHFFLLIFIFYLFFVKLPETKDAQGASQWGQIKKKIQKKKTFKDGLVFCPPIFIVKYLFCS